MNDTWTRTLNKHLRKVKKYLVHQTKADEKQHKNHKKHNTPQKAKKMRNMDFTTTTKKQQTNKKTWVSTCALHG
jgi:hypothetical protein